MILLEGHSRANKMYELDVQGNVRRLYDDDIVGQMYQDWGSYYFKFNPENDRCYAMGELNQIQDLITLI